MGKSSQRKGADAERELAAVLNEYGFSTTRGGSLTYGKIPDITGLPGIHIECKRCERLKLPEWMQQAVRDSDRFRDGLPTVFHRRNREQWLVTMRLSDWMRIYKKALKKSRPQEGQRIEQETAIFRKAHEETTAPIQSSPAHFRKKDYSGDNC